VTKTEIGLMAEIIAAEHERARLGVGDDSKYVNVVSGNPFLGYDIESVESITLPLVPRYIEVKAYGSSNSFFISRAELDRLKTLGDMAFLYLVDIKSGRVVHEIRNPVAAGVFQSAEVNSYKVVY
jgi:hypothetical protein